MDDSRSPKKWRHPISRLIRGGLELLSHVGMLALILMGVKAIELLMKWLWGGERLLFGRWPLAYIVDGSDLVLIAAFPTIGIYVVLRAYYGKRGSYFGHPIPASDGRFSPERGCRHHS